MSRHFSDSKKGRNRILIIAAISALPLIFLTVITWIWLVAYASSDKSVFALGAVLMLNVGISVWLLAKMLHRVRWGRDAWLGLSILWFLGFLALGYGFFFFEVIELLPVLIVLGLIYGLSGFSLYRNPYIEIFFRDDHTTWVEKIEELGQ